MVISTNLILEKIEKYLDALSSNSNEHSWRYCHDAFHPRSGKDADYLALQLTVYLASWGMYRGSSGLAKTNYTVHRGAAELILGFRNEIYLNNNRALLNASQIEQVIQLKGQLSAYYKSIKVNWPNEGLKAISPTDTLISKIILGSLGCVPAFDTYFLAGIKQYQIDPTFSSNSITQINAFIQENEPLFLALQAKHQEYTLIKLADMFFFQCGYDLLSKQDTTSPPSSPALR